MSFLGPKVEPATEEDYIRIQGGMPKVEKRGKLTIITHDYEGGEGMIVTSHIDHGTVILGNKECKIDLLRDLHGKPCEGQSRSMGGEGYDRKIPKT